MGGYRKVLECIGAAYIPIKEYLGNIRGYFELKKKCKKKTFVNEINTKYNLLKPSDQILFKACLLPDNCFNIIIQYCKF